jgi:hypothetical protein
MKKIKNSSFKCECGEQAEYKCNFGGLIVYSCKNHITCSCGRPAIGIDSKYNEPICEFHSTFQPDARIASIDTLK